MQDSWDSVVGIIKYYGDSQDAFQPYAGPGNWNDPDMVRVGNATTIQDMYELIQFYFRL